MPHTAGTNTADTLSAVFWIGAFEPPAFSIISTILDSVLSSPTFSARSSTRPVRLSVAEVIALPTTVSTGIDSPVIADLSSVVAPAVITPSHGTYSPGMMTTVSPTRISSVPTVSVLPSRITVAVFGRSFISFSTSVRVLPLERASSSLPSVTSVSIIAADSKNKFIASSLAPTVSPAATLPLIKNVTTSP